MSSPDERRRALLHALRVTGAICGSCGTLLGPVGTVKALDDASEPQLVGDALGVLSILDVQHPIAILLHESVFAQHAAHGSGTAQLLALIGGLCAEAERLERLGLAPATIARGFAAAAERCLDSSEELAVKVEQELAAAGATAARGGLRELPPAAAELPALSVTPPRSATAFPSHQLDAALATELEAEEGDDDIGWFFADEKVVNAAAGGSGALGAASPPDCAPPSPGQCVEGSVSPPAVAALALAAAGLGQDIARHLDADAERSFASSDGLGDFTVTHGSTASVVRYLGPAECDATTNWGCAWDSGPWRAIRIAGAGLHHGQPSMMELALVAALVLSGPSPGDTNAGSTTPRLDLSRVHVAHLLGGKCNAGVSAGSVQGGHYLISGMLHDVQATIGQLQNVRTGLRIRRSRLDLDEKCSEHGLAEKVVCATIDNGPLNINASEISEEQVSAALGCVTGGTVMSKTEWPRILRFHQNRRISLGVAR